MYPRSRANKMSTVSRIENVSENTVTTTESRIRDRVIGRLWVPERFRFHRFARTVIPLDSRMGLNFSLTWAVKRLLKMGVRAAFASPLASILGAFRMESCRGRSGNPLN